MSNKKIILFILNCIYAVALYYHYYDSTVFQQQSITIDSLWVIVKFFLIYGSPFIIAACLMDNWNLPKSYLMSMGLWISVYSFEYLTRSEEFTRLYPDGYQCLIVAITVYPGIGLSVLFGHVVGKVIKIFFDANQEHTESIEKTKKFTWIKK